MTRGTGARRVLFIVHGHPAFRPGGAENYARDLHRAMRETRWEPTLLARSGRPHAPAQLPSDGRRIAPIDGSSDEYALFTDGYDYDWLLGTIRDDKRLYTTHLRQMLEQLAPDVVHFQHTLFVGYDALREVRHTLPDASIVYTLHEYLPICHNQGQLVRTLDGSRCEGESPRRCAECFPDISPEQFSLRKRFVQAQLALADALIAPSGTLRDRYVRWGIPEERIVVEDYGLADPVSGPPPRPAPHRTFGFFGQLNPYKGIDLLLAAICELRDAGDEDGPRLVVNGVNLDLQPRRFRQRIEELRDACGEAVFWAGAYRPEQARTLMADVDWVVVPSTWIENSPLVIHEALASGRPVICSDVGGMSEKIRHGHNGLLFRAGDQSDLARTIAHAAHTPDLWEALSAHTGVVHSMDDHVTTLIELYERTLATRGAELRAG